MIIHCIAFTDKGYKLEEKVAGFLGTQGHEIITYEGAGIGKKPLDAFAREGFEKADALLYIGAAGIAVRSIAPYIKSKVSDPAVLVMDDCGRFVIPILSGHIGGANELADMLSKSMEATCVITTATDNNQVFAIDTWAKKEGLEIRNPEKIKVVSGKLLRGEVVTIGTDYKVIGPIPEQIRIVSGWKDADVRITTKKSLLEERAMCLQLVPKIYTLGIGCRKDTPYDKLQEFGEEILCEYDICKQSILRVASIDIKKEEEAICTYCQYLGVPYYTYSSQELNLVAGEFQESEFVKKVVGTDNVCERSAVAATKLQGGRLVVGKQKREGKTLAIACIDYSLKF